MSIGTCIIIGVGVGLWCSAWIAMIRNTDVGQLPWGWPKIKGIVLLFFIWWYIALAMMGQGDT